MCTNSICGRVPIDSLDRLATVISIDSQSIFQLKLGRNVIDIAGALSTYDAVSIYTHTYLVYCDVKSVSLILVYSQSSVDGTKHQQKRQNSRHILEFFSVW